MKDYQKINNSLLQAVLENLPLCIYIRDKRGNVAACSSMFEKEMSYLGKNRQLVVPENINLPADNIDEVFGCKRTIIEEKRVFFPNRTFYARIKKVPVLDKNNNVNYVITSYEDIEHEKESENQKKYFTETLAHDLKIPVLAQLRALELCGANSSNSELLSQIKVSCRCMLDIISDLEKTYKLENRKPLYSKFSITELLSACMREVSQEARDKKITFICSPSKENIFMEAGQSEIKKVVINLLENAVLHSFSCEKISILLSASDNQLNFSIKYRGSPLSGYEESRGYGADTKYTVIGQNAGINLCKKIIDIYGGIIFSSLIDINRCTLNLIIPQYRADRQMRLPIF